MYWGLVKATKNYCGYFGAERNPNQDNEGEHFVMFYLISYYSNFSQPFTCGGKNYNHMQTSGMKRLCC